VRRCASLPGSPNGEYFATASYDRTACVYGRQPDGSYELRRRFHFAGTVEALAFTPDSASVAFTARNDNYLHYVQLSDMAPTRYNMNKNGDDFVSFVGMDRTPRKHEGAAVGREVAQAHVGGGRSCRRARGSQCKCRRTASTSWSALTSRA